MLKSLQIENYAIIRSLDITFEDGFSVITGETGAGKSILLGALSLLLGNRAETDVLFDKNRKCIVEGLFNVRNLQLESIFESLDLDYQDDTTIRREINESGKSRAFINDTPVNLNTLKTVSSLLVDVHSQHKTLMLQNAGFRLALLDRYAKNRDFRDEYNAQLADWKRKDREYRALQEKCAEAATKFDYNNFVINELESANLQPDEQQELELKIAELSNAESIKTRLFNALNIISEQESINILHLLGELNGEVKSLSEIGPEYEQMVRRIESLRADAQDLSFDISRKNEQVEVNPELLNRLNERVDLLYTLHNKYHAADNSELLSMLAKYQQEAADFVDNKELLEKKRLELEDAGKKLEDSAKKLSESRKCAIPAFSEAVKGRLKMLGMNDSSFDVILSNKGSYAEEGIDEAVFMFSGNRGVGMSDLAKTASGGELSRIMLCLKSIITDSLLLPTVIFDEIDSGISGETASKVAEVMRHLAEHHQVISITHLPQIAAKGSHHFLVYKEADGDTTATKMRELGGEERERAIATMLSGGGSESALKTAREMIGLK